MPSGRTKAADVRSIFDSSSENAKIVDWLVEQKGFEPSTPLRFTLMLNSTSKQRRGSTAAARSWEPEALGPAANLANAEIYVGLVSRTQTSSAVLADR